MGVTIGGLNYLKRHGLAHFLDLRGVEFAADQTLYGIKRVRRVRNGLALCDLADEAFILIRKTDHGGGRAAAFFVGYDLHRSAFKHGYTAVGCAQVDSNYFAHVASSSAIERKG